MQGNTEKLKELAPGRKQVADEMMAVDATIADQKEAVRNEIIDRVYEAENYRMPVSVVAVANEDEINNTNQGGYPYA